jgi:hypothetical protein
MLGRQQVNALQQGAVGEDVLEGEVFQQGLCVEFPIELRLGGVAFCSEPNAKLWLCWA